MKKIKIIAAILAAATLCGCSDKGGTSSESSMGSVSIGSSLAESSAALSKPESSGVESAPNGTSSDAPAPSVPNSSEDVPDENASFLVGLAGDRILKSEITTVFTADGSDCDPANLTEELFQAVLCSGFAYLGESSGAARNSIDNADVYDSANMEFTDMSSAPVKNYVRVNVGETICGLTLEEAEVNFARGLETTIFETADGSNKLGSELGMPEIYFTGGTAKFSGEITLEGYIMIAPENVYGVGVGDIIFVPCDGQAKLPIMSYRLDGVNGFYHTSQMYALNAKLAWQNEFGYIHLGNVLVTDADTSSIPDGGSFVKATVTIDSYELSCGLNFVNSVKAKPVSIDVE